MNAVKHGLRTQRAVLPDEDEQQYAELVEQLREEFAPSTVIEDELVSQAAAILWKLARARRAIERFLFGTRVTNRSGSRVRTSTNARWI